MQKLQEAMDDGAQETDKDLWDSFIERFKFAFTNQNQRKPIKSCADSSKAKALTTSLLLSNNLPMKQEFL